MYRERRRETRCTKAHRLEFIKRVRYRHHPVALYACVLRIAAVVRFTKLAPGYEDFVTHAVASIVGCDHLAGEIYPSYEGVFAQDLPRTSGSESVLVVDGGVANLDHHVACAEVVQSDGFKA